MKISRSQFLLLAPASLATRAFANVEIGGDTDAPKETVLNPLKTLKPGHPRLIATDTDVLKIKKNIATDPIARHYFDGVREEGEKILSEKPVEYIIVGPRLLEQSRLCLRRVYSLALLYRLDGDLKWADRAKKELAAAAAFPSWNPSHFLDTAEMTHAFAIGYDWLYATLTEAERKTIREAIVQKGLLRGKEAYIAGKGWPAAHHNWNQVCNGGLSLGALAIADEEPELAEFILNSALKSLPLAMGSFAPDGGWDEGPGYWSYTLRYTVALLAGLQTALGTDFGISETPGFDRTGAFRLYFVGPNGGTFTYADVSDGKAGSAPSMHWLAKRFGQPLYAWEAKRAAGKGSPQDLLWYNPTTATNKEIPLDNVFRGVDVAFLRSSWEDSNALWIGFKGGNNAANHSHLDLGTFVFDALGERWVSDIGSDNYNLPLYFGAKRWEYYRLRTEGQNTLLLNGANQGTKAKAPIVAFSSASDGAYAVADLTAGYTTAGATRVYRGVGLINRRKALLIQDEFSANGPVEYKWQVHTLAAITEISPDGREATLTLNGKVMMARLLSPTAATFAEESAAPPPINGGEGPQQNPNAGIRKLVVRLSGTVNEARVAVLLAPSGDISDPVTLTPLADWIKEAPPLPERGGSLKSA